MTSPGAQADELAGKVALVTGAGSGIGYSIAERFADEGAAVAIDYLGHGEDAHALARELSDAGKKAVALEADVTDATAVEALVEIAEVDWDRTLAVDLKGPFLCLQAVARRMKDKGGGSIVNISSIHEDFPFPSYTPLAAHRQERS